MRKVKNPVEKVRGRLCRCSCAERRDGIASGCQGAFFFFLRFWRARSRCVSGLFNCFPAFCVSSARAFSPAFLTFEVFFVLTCPSVADEGESKKRPQEEEPEGAGDVATKKSAGETKVVLEKAVSAIRALRSFSGSSLKAIQKQLGAEAPEAAALKEALKAGVASKTLTQNKMSFLVTGESYPDPTPRIEILETTPAPDAGAAKCKNGELVAITYTGKRRDKREERKEDERIAHGLFHEIGRKMSDCPVLMCFFSFSRNAV